MSRTRIKELTTIAALAMCALAWQPSPTWAQTRPSVTATAEPPDAQHTKDELNALLEHYPPALHNVLALDPSLLGNESYLAPYPALVSFLNAHPEIARNPAFYMGEHLPQDRTSQTADMWRDVVNGLGIFAGFGMAIGLLVWLIRTLVDYRRWSRLSKVQTDVHTKLLDRFTANDDLLAYVQSPAEPDSAVRAHRAGCRATRRGRTAEPDSVVRAGRRGAAGGRHRNDHRRRTGDGCDVTTIARRTGRAGHRAGPGLHDIGDNLLCNLAAAGFD